MAQHLTTPAAIALGFGLTSSAWISGNIISLSTMAAPAILAAPVQSTPASTLTTQWTKMYRIGRSAMPKAAFLSLVSYLYVAISLRSLGRTAAEWSGFAAAGLLTVGIGPYTLATMMRTNNLLESNSSASTAAGGLTSSQVQVLVQRWQSLNAIRSLFPLLGAAVGMWSLFSLV